MAIARMPRLALVATGLAVLAATQVPIAQGSESFKARLTSLPVDAVTAPTMRGSGSATAVLDGNALTVTAKFEGLSSPATQAHLHRAIRGLRGPSVFDLPVTKGTNGTIEHKLTLTAAQIADLRRGWFYVQIHTEANPEGHLRGWLLNK